MQYEDVLDSESDWYGDLSSDSLKMSMYSSDREDDPENKFWERDEEPNSLQRQMKQSSVLPSSQNPFEKQNSHNQAGLTLQATGKFFNETGEQFIKVEKKHSNNVKCLNFSALLFLEDIIFALHNIGCLMVVGTEIVAEVEIQQPSLLEEAKNFADAKTILFHCIRIVKIVASDTLNKIENIRKTLLSGLENVLIQSAVDKDSRFARIELSEITEKLNKSGMSCNNSVCGEIERSRYLSKALKRQASALSEEEKRAKELQFFKTIEFLQVFDSQYLFRSLQKLLSENAKRHTDFLMETAVNNLQHLLKNVSKEKQIFITKDDVVLFADMGRILSEEIFAEPLRNLQQRWIQRIDSEETDKLKTFFPTTNKIYLYLCKSLEDLIVQISDKTGTPECELLLITSSGWRKKTQIRWLEEDVSTKCLERQYNFIFRLLDHFDFGKSSNREPFRYDNNDEGSGIQSNFEDIPEELLVWYYLLYDTLVEILPTNCTSYGIENILKSYKKLFYETCLDQLDTLRIATHNALQSISYMLSVPKDSKYNNNNQQSDATLNAARKFVDSTGQQFIKAKKSSSKNFNNLNFSAKVTYAGLKIVIHGEGCLMKVNDDLVAEVEIQEPSLLEGATNFEDAKSILFRQIRIVKVLSNDTLAKLEQSRKPLLSRLENMLQQSTVDKDSRIAGIELSEIAEKLNKSGMSSNSNVCQAIEKAYFSSDELKSLVAFIDEEERKYCKKQQAYEKIGVCPENGSQYLYQGIQNLLGENAKRYAIFLKEIAPKHLQESFSGVSGEKLILVHKNDVKLFADMASVLNEEIFLEPMLSLQQRWVKKINSMETNRLNGLLQTTNTIFFFLCKSLGEIIDQISEKTGIKAATLLESDSSGWKKKSHISWKKEDVSSKCLERQYNFLFLLLDHFDLGASSNQKPFKYSTKLFTNSKNNSSVLNVFENFKLRHSADNCESTLNLSGIPEEVCVWFYMLDDALDYILTKDCNLNLIEKFLQSYLKLLRETKQEQVEALRVATHKTIQFIIEIVPYMSPGANDSSVDQLILQIQCDKISCQLSSNTSNYRDLVNVFGNYWKGRSEIITEIIAKMPHPSMDLLKHDLLNIVLLALEKSVESDSLLAFFRTYEEFLTDLNEVPFDWFIKSIPNIDMQVFIRRNKIDVVDNKIKDMPARTYRVLDPKGFTEICQSQGHDVAKSKHYVIEVLLKLLAHVVSQLQRKSWNSGGELSTADQLSTASELMSTIYHSLLYLKEQADYVSFEKFYAESVDPFTSLIKHSTSKKDFSTRVHLLKESFWFIRKQNEMDVATVLKLYKKLNPNFDADSIKQPYEKYMEHFDSFMQMSVGKDCPDAASSIAKKVNELVSKDKHFTTWDNDFKQQKVPQILAGLGAVWSILVSKDVSSAGKYLSPNCVQVLCVLRLLSVDTLKKGVEKHLAQVLTGQGKSLILAMVSAMLALTGHTVHIGCYSKYLVERDRDNFQDFYSTLKVTGVTYGSLNSLMEKFINPEVDGKTIKLRSLVEGLLFHDKTSQSNKLSTSTFDKSILLFDEVDVFFSKNFYGNTYNPGVFSTISGIDKIQEFIWEMVTQGDSSVENIMNKVWEEMKSADFMRNEKFQTFRARSNSYKILTDNGELRIYTNQSLLDEHLRQMIVTAIDVFNSPAWHWYKYRLSCLENITYKVNEEFVTGTVSGYRNSFVYFRLKKKDFVSCNYGAQNYGYLLMDCGSLSFAMLPMNYPLILGVSGTLTDLNNYEKKTIEKLYGINQLSVMPTFYGSSNLRFDETENFHYFPTKPSWRNYIFSQTNKIVMANRAVLIFFDDDFELNEFKSEYAGQLDRLNVLTENTANKEKCISEAGIVKTITLATRGMGRGVDYKSSLLVEKNEGVHVIQTFFSMDVKEETQIKGRTARQDNKGSYEIVVCTHDLKKCKLISEDDSNDENNDKNVSYGKLFSVRNSLSNETNLSISKAIENNKITHNATMDYLKSFFRS